MKKRKKQITLFSFRKYFSFFFFHLFVLLHSPDRQLLRQQTSHMFISSAGIIKVKIKCKKKREKKIIVFLSDIRPGAKHRIKKCKVRTKDRVLEES